MHAHSCEQYFLVWYACHSLGRDSDLMATFGQGVREVEHVPLLAANVRREELGKHENAHQ